jgi:hypothetical protein
MWASLLRIHFFRKPIAPVIVWSGMDIMAAPIAPPKTRSISPGLRYAPISPWVAWNIE